MADAPLCPGPDPDPHAPAFAIPPLACDCHVHVFGPKYPYQQERSYTPPDAPVGRLRHLHDNLGLARAVIVQASVHGVDNSAVLDAVASDPERYRGVAAVGEDVTDKELERLNAGGIRGVRLNLVDKGGMPFSSLGSVRDFADRIRDMDWHVELLVHVEQSEELNDLVRALSVPVSVGHVGYTKTAAGIDHPGYRRFLDLLGDGFCWVKLTGPYRISAREAFPYDDVRPFAEAVVEAAPDRIVWGSDWPHVLHYRRMPNDGDLLDSLAEWVPDARQREKILVDNPAKLYGFA